MKLILTADVDNLGAPGDTVEVKDGYGRNYLLPRGLAIVATRGAEKQVEGIRRAQEARAVRGLDHAKELKQAIEGLESVSLSVKTAGDSGKLFGSVTAADVAGCHQGCRWTRSSTSAASSCRRLTSRRPASTPIVVNLHPDVVAKFDLNVVGA